MEHYRIIRNEKTLGTIEVDKTKHQPTYTVTNIGGKVSSKVNIFKNRCVMCKYLEWAYPGARLEKELI